MMQMLFLSGELEDIDRQLYIYSEDAHLDDDVIDFWSKALMEMSFHRQTLPFSLSEAQAVFTLRGIFPSSLEKAIQKLLAKGVLRPTVVASGGVGGSKGSRDSSEGWLVSLFSLLSFTTTPSHIDFDCATFYHSQVVEELLKCLLTHASSKVEADRVLSTRRAARPGGDEEGDGWTLRGFLRAAAVAVLDQESQLRAILLHPSDADVNILLAALIDGGYAAQDGEVVLLLPSASSTPIQLTEGHKTLVYLRQTIHDLTSEVERLEEKMQRNTREASLHKAQGRKEAALVSLHLKKLCTNRRNSLYSALIALHETLQMVEREGDHAMTLAGYRLATQQLRAQRTNEKMSVNSVGEAIQDFKQEMDSLRQMESMMAGDQMTAEEERDLEKELEELLVKEARTGSKDTADQPSKRNNRQQKAAEETTSWPQPPSHALQQSFNKEDARSIQPSATSSPVGNARTR
eukprot:gene10775-11976_t